MPGPDLHPLSALLRRYAYSYTASHDLSIIGELMVDDYELLMGPFVARGREQHYRPATEKQYRQYPGLGFTVHELLNNGSRAAFRFSEHGRSLRNGQDAVWRGISLYEYDGERLTRCRVEQDYESRQRQAADGRADVIPAPAMDPWTAPPAPADAAGEQLVRDHLCSAAFLTAPGIVFDAEDAGDHPENRVRLDAPTVEVLDLFGAGPAVAAHVAVDGSYLGGLGDGFASAVGSTARLYATAILHVAPATGDITGHVVTDRLACGRRLSAAIA
ncbi:nuclear transport factor 2 family protein [Nakamurella sp. YIM 132087]|uniref:Nuclear transport factor 2 family protein n=1 Tax=Nakamurella alba TaxID=2665158 RepID=A0A7K1FKD9_9ACTN|nr:nuclear transport factor 2 family protein [Nakamurella alba]MTD13879.1 nuclear transport factor 2 family protein [Nakamurella alba]